MEEHSLAGDAMAALKVSLDVTMMAMNGGKERTRDEWQRLFMPEAPEPVLAAYSVIADERSDTPLAAAAKHTMLIEALQELSGGYIELCRRRLLEESVTPEQLLQGLRELMGALDRLHTLVPDAELLQRASRAAELLAD